jgi:hypothetical protein
VSEIVNGKPAPGEIFIERERSAFARGVHVVVRQNFVPRISFHAKLEVAVPDVGRNAVLHFTRRHMIIKFLATGDCVSQGGEKLAWSFKDFGNRINQSLVIARLMSCDRRRNRRHDVHRPAMFAKENFDARAGGFGRFNEDKFVFVRNDHRVIGVVDCVELNGVRFF